MRGRLISFLFVPAGAFIIALTASAFDEAETGAEHISPTSDETAPVAPEMVAAPYAPTRMPGESDDLPPFDDVAKDFSQVVSTADGAKGLYTVWTREKDAQLLAELPRNFEQQKLFIAFTIAGGTQTAGVQFGDLYAYWKRFDKTLALIEPNFSVRTTGDLESQKGLSRVFTDRVILDIPIVANGKGGGPVVDLDALLLGQSNRFFGGATAGANIGLAKISKAKAFPQNIEIAFELPLAGGHFGTIHYSISVLPENTGYQPRVADERVGYFATSHRDIGHPDRDTPWVRYINRWKLEKADPKLRMSPPKEPIVFYLEHTTPVRYRRWVREGVLEWNKAYEKVGIVGAIEVYQQDARTGAHMEKDPEDARYNFLLWTNANMGFAIGPSRVDPRTGQILDADIVMDEGFISSWVKAWEKLIPEISMIGYGPQTQQWLASNPQWDPRVRLAPPAEREKVQQQLLRAHWRETVGHPAGEVDATLLGDDLFDGLAGRISQVNGRCEVAMGIAPDLALFRMDPALLTELAAARVEVVKAREEEDEEEADDAADDTEGDEDDEADDEDEEGDEDADDEEDDDAEDETSGDNGRDLKKSEQMLDGIPESFVGPLLKSIIMHEVGHTLGLRHNFKASTIRSLEEINSPEFDTQPITGSVMDYIPLNINYQDGDEQGPYCMVALGPYDEWAIEYGYSLENDLNPVLQRVAEPDLIYGTDEDSWSSDPRARVFDLGSNPLDYADSQMRLVHHLRTRILDRMVKDGQSWSKAREGYELLLAKHFGALSIAANWIGGAYANRDKKGDPGDRAPVAPVEAEQQRRALEFTLEHAFNDEAFGLTPEILAKMSIDKWWDEGFMNLFEDPAWPVHDRILAIRAAVLTMLMNPGTLNDVYDNEFRIPAEEDALTLPELLYGVSDSVWSELDDAARTTYTARQPMISSMRRDLQREHLERLIDLTMPNPGLGAAAKPVANLSVHKLRELQRKVESLIEKRAAKLDPYSLAHLSEAQVRISKALDAQYIYNAHDIGAGGPPVIIFGQPEE